MRDFHVVEYKTKGTTRSYTDDAKYFPEGTVVHAVEYLNTGLLFWFAYTDARYAQYIADKFNDRGVSVPANFTRNHPLVSERTD